MSKLTEERAGAIRRLLASPKTTAAGVAALLGVLAVAAAALLDGDATTDPNWSLIVPLLITAFLGFVGRDSGETSEPEGGTKKKGSGA